MSIKNWKEDDRPREKFITKGRQSVSDSELLAILIGMGDKENSALDLAKKIMIDSDNSLTNLSKLSTKELTKFKGIGPAKAVAIATAFELGLRANASENKTSKKIKSSRDAFDILLPYYHGLRHEEFFVLFLARNLSVISVDKISMGGTSSTVVDFKIIAKHAIEHLASSVILSHNHPSGELSPSKEDDRLTIKAKEALSLFDISISDHIIVGDKSYYSFADEGRI
jgi:DNA repair protein RadC